MASDQVCKLNPGLRSQSIIGQIELLEPTVGSQRFKQELSSLNKVVTQVEILQRLVRSEGVQADD